MQETSSEIANDTNTTENEIIDNLSLLAKFVTTATVFSSAFGLCYQKGLISGMGLGNLSGNYDLKEIFNSAIFGYLDILTNIKRANIFDALVNNWIAVAFLTVLGTLYPLASKYRSESKKDEVNAIKDKAKSVIEKITRSWWLSGLIGFIIGLISNIILTFAFYLAVLMSFFLMLPAFLGYSIGHSKAINTIESPACGKTTDERIKSGLIRQCTHMTLDGLEINGEIMLENAGGYFFHLNDAFLYVSKDRKNCVYSKFITVPKDQQVNKTDTTFKPSTLDKFCNTPLSQLEKTDQ